MLRPFSLLAPLLCVVMLLTQTAVGEEIRVSDRDALDRALGSAKAGTTILIAAGKYKGGLHRAKLTGTKALPIVLAAADPDKPPVFEGGGSGLHLASPAHVELRDLVFKAASGNGLNIDDSGSPDTPAHNLILRNIVVSDVGPRGNRDGIKLSGLKDFRLEGCRVENWGSSGSAIDMVGCTSGVVKNCKFLNAGGDLANGVQTKGGSSKIVIQHCRFENAGGRAVNVGGSTGLDHIRPRDAKHEAHDITVEDCEFLGGMSAIAFVGVDGAVVRHNTIYRPRRWPLRILQENVDPRFVTCRNGKFENNVVAFRSDEVREVVNIGAKTQPETFAFSDNVWCCLDRPADTKRIVRLPVAEKNGEFGTTPKFEDPIRGNINIADRKPTDPGARREDNSK